MVASPGLSPSLSDRSGLLAEHQGSRIPRRDSRAERPALSNDTSMLLQSPEQHTGADSSMEERSIRAVSGATAAKGGQLTTLPLAGSGISSAMSGQISAWADENWSSASIAASIVSNTFERDEALYALCQDTLARQIKRTAEGGTEKSKIQELAVIAKQGRKCINCFKRREEYMAYRLREHLECVFAQSGMRQQGALPHLCMQYGCNGMQSKQSCCKAERQHPLAAAAQQELHDVLPVRAFTSVGCRRCCK